MTLTGYFDESERRDRPEQICVGGYLFKPTAYRQFCRQWKRTVLRFDGRSFAAFHATDLYAGRGEYEGLSISDRVQILDRAVDAITTHMFAGIGVRFDVAEFVAGAPKGWAQGRGSIYTTCCQVCLHSAAFWINDRRDFSKISYVFERGHKYQHEADALLRAIGRHEGLRQHFNYQTHMFEEKQRACGLHAADLFAWWGTKSQSGDRGRALEAFLGPLFRLSATREDHQRMTNFTWDLLDEFFLEQLNGVPEVSADTGPRKRDFK
jgi:hypothetical protein